MPLSTRASAKAASAEDKIKVAADPYGTMTKVLRKISSGLPQNQKAVSETFKTTIGEIKTLVDSAVDKSDDDGGFYRQAHGALPPDEHPAERRRNFERCVMQQRRSASLTRRW